MLYVAFHARFPERYDAMFQICHDLKLKFVESALISSGYTTTHKFAPTCPFYTESTLIHTMPIAVSALLNFVQHKALIRTLFSLLELYKNTQPNWFCFPNNATLSNGNGFVRCSANGDVNELRERCRNLGQLGMI